HFFNSGRKWLLCCFGASIGRDVIIRPTVRVTYPWKISIGDYSWIGDGVILYSLDRISIGSHSVISQQTYLCTGSHDLHDAAFALKTAPIAVGNGVWIAAQCFVAPGVEIGSNAVVGVRSTVLSSMPAGYVCWGHPCRPQQARSLRDKQ
ncbi:MAG: colanic acid biosynthesis acetyltransferase WcaF, partial [Microcoleus sp. SIO2G3]|nr:colanic acid biosynthesis acetyltransferase WcaF [Microcoleus sp. SIO2G3]